MGIMNHLARAASKDIDESTQSYLLSAVMNFKPTSMNLKFLTDSNLPSKLPALLSSGDSGQAL